MDNTVPALSKSASRDHHPTPNMPYPIFLDLSVHSKTPDELALTPTYISLLGTMFPVDQGYLVGSGYGPEGTQGTRPTDYAAFIVVYQSFCRAPVLLVEIRSFPALSLESARERADGNMRSRMGDYHHRMVTDVLYGLSIFGSRVAFYRYEKLTQRTTPAYLPPQMLPCPSYAVPVETRWNCDLLTPEGGPLLRDVVDEVKYWINTVYIRHVPGFTLPDFPASTSPIYSDEQALEQSHNNFSS